MTPCARTKSDGSKRTARLRDEFSVGHRKGRLMQQASAPVSFGWLSRRGQPQPRTAPLAGTLSSRSHPAMALVSVIRAFDYSKSRVTTVTWSPSLQRGEGGKQGRGKGTEWSGSRTCGPRSKSRGRVLSAHIYNANRGKGDQKERGRVKVW